jgi:hypothetical protein
MAFEKTRAEIDILLQQLVEPPEDAREIEQRLREKLNELRAFGMPLPSDLVDLEQTLDQQLTAAARLDERGRR